MRLVVENRSHAEMVVADAEGNDTVLAVHLDIRETVSAVADHGHVELANNDGFVEVELRNVRHLVGRLHFEAALEVELVAVLGKEPEDEQLAVNEAHAGKDCILVVNHVDVACRTELVGINDHVLRKRIGTLCRIGLGNYAVTGSERSFDGTVIGRAGRNSDTETRVVGTAFLDKANGLAEIPFLGREHEHLFNVCLLHIKTSWRKLGFLQQKRGQMAPQ